MANNSGMSRRAALKQQQELEERNRKNRRLLAFGLGAVALVVVVILGIVILQTVGQNREVTANQQTPPNGTEAGGVMLTSQAEEASDDAPHLVIYEDYQCPACAAREAAYGPAIKELVDAGSISVEIRTAVFMEEQLMNDSSTRPAIAAAAADAVGKYREYHSTIYANQHPQGGGYTDQQLREEFPAAVGIEGEDLTRFQELYDTQAFQEFVDQGNQTFMDEGIRSTPTYVVGDTQLQFVDENQQVLIEPTAEDLLAAIEAAAA